MNTKTYCPVGKIDCKRFKGISQSVSHDIFCNADLPNMAYHYILPDFYEVCPFPTKQEKIERYNMCEDQSAQIDCRAIGCIWHDNCGNCKNISPAITLYDFNDSHSFHCYSFGEKP